jgi:hypothetical protein
MIKSITSLIICLMIVPVSAQAHDHDPVTAMADGKDMKTRPALAVSATVDNKNRLWLVRVENQHVLVSSSEDNGRHFSSAVTVNAEPENVGAEGENRPKIAVTNTGTLHLTWTRLLSQPYTGEIRYSRSNDGGKTFSTPVTLNDDKHVTSHRFDSLVSDGGNKLAVVWLDGRDRDLAKERGEKFPGVSVYAARSDDNGASFQPNQRITEHTCECCRTSIVWTSEGPIAQWRNLYGTNTRDFAIANLDSGKVQRLTDDEWAIDACPHHGGWIAAGGDDVVHAVWYTNGKTRQGLFYRQVKGAAMSTPMPFGNPNAQAGHATVASEGKKVLIAWREFDGKSYVAMALQSTDNGKSWSEARRVATTDDAADYPLPLIHQGTSRIVWNTLREGVRAIGLE